MNRRTFIQQTGITGAGLLLKGLSAGAQTSGFPVVRTPVGQRNFSSPVIERAIGQFAAGVKNREIAWLFNNCFPNTLDTTVYYENKNGKPDTYVITGDIDAMWLRDSSAQVWPYIPFCKEDNALQQLIAGIIRRQAYCINKDPYANAFYKDEQKKGEWQHDITAMQPGIHERKWEIDSLCYPIRLAYQYWKTTGDSSPFDSSWQLAIQKTLQTFKEQQRKTGDGPYSFQRKTSWATDGVPMNGYGYPVKPVGLIASSFRPSDDATVFSFLIPSNFFAVVSLRQAAEMMSEIAGDKSTAQKLAGLAAEVEKALAAYAVVTHPVFGQIYAYEVNGMGSYNLMDDANIPGLLALPYLGGVKETDPLYRNTRRFVLSDYNPFYFKGSIGEGIGGPHIGKDMVWPMSIIMRGLTSNNTHEITECIEMLRKTHGGTGFMHESFHKDDPTRYTRKWFAWANTLMGEFLWKTWKQYPSLLA